MGDTEVSSVSPRSSRKVVMIETTAMKIGMIARNEANTKVRTASAPRPPSTASSSRPGPSLSAPLSSNSASKPVRWTGCARDGRPPQHRACLLLRLRVLAEDGVGIGARIHDRERGAAVLRDERVVARRRIGGHARAGQRLVQLPVDPGEVGADARGVDALALGQGHDGDQRRRVAAGAAVALLDGPVRLPALLVGDRELGVERVRGRAGGRDAGDRQDDPCEYDGALVCEDPAGERGQGSTSGQFSCEATSLHT